jgi:ubiquinone/menaquinone biosynthesis C-methylase UbiE
MIKETLFFLRHGPAIQKRKKELGLVAFMQAFARDIDADGYAALRTELVGELRGDVLEIGTGTGATFPYYRKDARVCAIEPDDDFRAAAEHAAENAHTEIRVLPGAGETLPFEDDSFDAVCASLVLCSVTSPAQTLEEFKRVLRPGGQVRLMEHVRSEHWLAGPLMVILNPIWLRINNVGCNWHRRTVETVREAGFAIQTITAHKIYSKAAATAFPIRIIKAVFP